MKTDKNKKILELAGLTKVFGGLVAVQGLDLEVKTGEIMGLIGPNGAGKTTVFNLTSGVLMPTEGKVLFNGEDITHLKPDRIAQKGLVRTFQANTLFPEFTVMENVLLGCHLQADIGFFEDLFPLASSRKKRDRVDEKAMDIINFAGMHDYRRETAKNLAHGYQRLLGVAIALAAKPRLLMLDEPVSGMNAEEKTTMMELIFRVREQGISVLVVEHDMRVVMGLCDRIAVLNFGRKIAQGTPSEIQNNKDVIEAYLGVDE